MQTMQKIQVTIAKQGIRLAGIFQCLETINQPYSCLITLPEQYQQDIIGKPLSATLHYNDSKEPRYFHGIIREYQQQRSQVLCIPWLGLLRFEKPQRRFIDKSIPSIIQEIFRQHQFHDYDMHNLMHQYRKHTCLSQYQETTLQFINRLCQQAGLYYWFEHSEERTTILFADDIRGFYTHNHSNWQQMTSINDATGKTIFKATSEQQDIHIASLIHQKHEPSELSLITEIFHEMDLTRQLYRCRVTAENWPIETTPCCKALIHGIQTATVTERRPSQIQCCFDWETTSHNSKSQWIDYASPFASNGVGLQFTPDIGHQVIVMFLEGNPDQPNAIGSLYNANNKPPYPLPQYKNNMTLKSRSGNELNFIDLGNKSKCLLTASYNYCETITNNRNINIQADQHINVKGDYTLSICNGRYTVTAKQAITLSCGDSHIHIKSNKITLRADKIFLN